MTNPTAAILIIGNEILSGRTQDANINAIAVRLLPLGIRLAEVRVVPDIEAEIVAAVNALRARYDYLFTTGGIGPTHDDITATSVAAAFGKPVIVDPVARERLLAYYGTEKINTARLRMARVPEGATLITNPISAAPGFQIANVYVMAGVPEVMRAMLDEVAARLRTGPAFLSRTVQCVVAESLIADELADLAAAYDDCDIGSYPWFRQGKYGVALVARGTDPARLDLIAERILAIVRVFDAEAQRIND
ncbi:MAG: competence/damage-inducible protein A [Alphaproteobacteria bacterium]